MLRIPKVFHRIWLGGRPMPEKFVRFGETWLKHHPGWTMKLWNESNLPPLINELEFGLATQMAQRADILRYEIIFKEGGVYLDTDFECVQSIEKLLDGVDAFAACEKPDVVSIGILGGVAGHKSWKKVIDALPKSYRVGTTVTRQTGPRFVTPLLFSEPGFIKFGQALFYPIPWGQPTEVAPPPGSYGIHHWASSWLSKAPNAPIDIATDEVRAHFRSGGESLSGPASSIEATKVAREFIERVINQQSIQTILDVPCGDFHWMQKVPLDGVDYRGLDFVPVLIDRNRRAFPQHTFDVHDLIRAPIPAADLLICRDFLFLRTDHDVRRAVANLIQSGSRWLIATTAPGEKTNRDLPAGRRNGYRLINLEIAPWKLGAPVEIVRETHAACGGRSLGLWDLEAVRASKG